ncbi:hypothetical protein [Mycoplasmopsis felis]|uniref:hypothetical protein n=1 Tax=Mycoplasmopsis felis TaxID=33923 RepID=UPI002FF1FE93
MILPGIASNAFLYITVLKILETNGNEIAKTIVNKLDLNPVLITTVYCPDNKATSGKTNKESATNQTKPFPFQLLNEKAITH